MPSLIQHAAGWECLFCTTYMVEEADLSWYDRPLFKNDGVGVAITAVGAFVPGYLLVAPAQHKSSLQELADAGAEFVEFVELVVDQVQARYGPSTVFEHGSCTSLERRRSACITHSHIHVVPGSYSFGTLGLPVQEYARLRDIVDLPKRERANGYLMYQEPGGCVCYAPDVGISQYFRRQIARVLGCPDEWDYAIFPRWENVRATLDEFAVRTPRTASLTATPSQIAAAECL